MKGLFYEKSVNMNKMTLRCMDILENIVVVGSFSKEIFLIDLDEKDCVPVKFDFFNSKVYSVKFVK
jgi:hypothetical protein